MKRYQAKPFSQVQRGTLYAVWDWRVGNYVVEANGLVCASEDKEPVQIWAKYLNDNLPYQNPLNDKPLSKWK